MMIDLDALSHYILILPIYHLLVYQIIMHATWLLRTLAFYILSLGCDLWLFEPLTLRTIYLHCPADDDVCMTLVLCNKVWTETLHYDVLMACLVRTMCQSVNYTWSSYLHIITDICYFIWISNGHLALLLVKFEL